MQRKSRQKLNNDEPWSFDGPPAEITSYQAQHVPLNCSPKKRSGTTPEAKVAADCVKYLEKLDFYILRTGAGLINIDGRKIAVGRKGGHDYTCCAPNGKFVSIEVKSATGKPSDAQLRQQRFIERRGGIVIIPHSVGELLAGLVAAFGEQTVADWEILGKARKR